MGCETDGFNGFFAIFRVNTAERIRENPEDAAGYFL